MGTKALIEELKDLAKRIRKDILDMALAADASHFGSALSIVEIMAVLYGHIMKHAPGDPEFIGRDRFILSKGHGCLAYYAVLAELGYFPKEELLSFEKNGSFLAGHPCMNRKKGIEFSTGSLGQGLGLGVGIAKSYKMRNMNNKVFVLMGDGELNEGSVWEAAMSARDFESNNLVAIIDKNGFQLGGSTSEIMYNPNLVDKWKAFGWNVLLIDGHNFIDLLTAFKYQSEIINRPTVIIAETIKGYPFSFSANNNAFHHAPISQQQYDQAMFELKQF